MFDVSRKFNWYYTFMKEHVIIHELQNNLNWALAKILF